MSSTTIVALADDPVILRNLRRLVETPDVSVVNFSSIDDLNLDEPPLAVVLGLEQSQAMEMVKHLKKQWPETLVAGFLLLVMLFFLRSWWLGRTHGRMTEANTGPRPEGEVIDADTH